jgi:hypothetical protein
VFVRATKRSKIRKTASTGEARMSIYEYWIGRDLNLNDVWRIYEEGQVPHLDFLRS